jgi:tetratricopeptide (TPR) repeat protein
MMNGMGRLGLVVMLGASIASTGASAAPEARFVPDIGTGPIAVPVVPSFEMVVPSANAMGARQLRAMGRRAHDGKKVVVRGYVTFVYDCVEQNLEPYKTRAQIAKEVAADPKKCEPARLYLGDVKTTPKEFSLHVADLPETIAWKVGDYLELEGTFAFTSPRGDKDRVGLVVMSSAKIVKPEVGTKTQLPAPVAVTAMAAPKPMRASPPPDEKMRSIGAAMETARKHAEWLSWKDAQAEYRRVLATWDGHHLAWFELGRVYAIPGMDAEAAEAFGRAFALLPTQPVYAYEYGKALWLRDYYIARRAEAKRLGIHEEYVELSAAEAKLTNDRPQQLLEYAISLVPEQWRAHEAVGAIYEARGDFKLAASAWTNAVARGPRDYSPYWRLARLYREWGYEDEALAVALAWMKVRAPDDSSDRMYEIAAEVYEAKGELNKAIDMLSIILAAPTRAADNAALFRARLYIATKQYDKARLDLAPFATHNRSKMREVNLLLSKIPAPRKKR